MSVTSEKGITEGDELMVVVGDEEEYEVVVVEDGDGDDKKWSVQSSGQGSSNGDV